MKKRSMRILAGDSILIVCIACIIILFSYCGNDTAVFDLNQAPETVVFTDRAQDTVVEQNTTGETTFTEKAESTELQTQATTLPAETVPESTETTAVSNFTEDTATEAPPSTEAPPATEAMERSAAIDGGADEPTASDYVLNTNSKKFHLPTCGSVTQMKSANRKDVHDSRDALIAQGYAPCKRCNP